jgi:hypothetical protein
MGLIRKTLSITTLGLVDFRSKKEALERAEKSRQKAVAELRKESGARKVDGKKVAAAEKRLRAAELQALHAAKQAAKLKGRKGKKGRSLLETLEAALGSAIDTAEPKVQDLGRRGVEGAQDLGRRGRKAAKKAAARAKVEAAQARKLAKQAKKRAEPYVDKAVDVVHDLREEAEERFDEVREKVRR